MSGVLVGIIFGFVFVGLVLGCMCLFELGRHYTDGH
jgi:hypothetical protein